jgi:hypothetical protein
MSNIIAPENTICIMLSGILASFVIGYLLAWYNYGYPTKLDTGIIKSNRVSQNQQSYGNYNTIPNKGPGSERFHEAKLENQQENEDHDQDVIKRMKSTAKQY